MVTHGPSGRAATRSADFPPLRLLGGCPPAPAGASGAPRSLGTMREGTSTGAGDGRWPDEEEELVGQRRAAAGPPASSAQPAADGRLAGAVEPGPGPGPGAAGPQSAAAAVPLPLDMQALSERAHDVPRWARECTWPFEAAPHMHAWAAAHHPVSISTAVQCAHRDHGASILLKPCPPRGWAGFSGRTSPAVEPQASAQPYILQASVEAHPSLSLPPSLPPAHRARLLPFDPDA